MSPKPANKKKHNKSSVDESDGLRRSKRARADESVQFKNKSSNSGREKESKTVKKSTEKENVAKAKSMNTEILKTGKMFVGAHVSAAGGLHRAVEEAVEIGAKSFALFLRSQRQWASKPLDDNIAAKFNAASRDHGFASHMILPHGSYLMNCGSPKPEILKKSRDTLVDEMKRCDKLNIALYNFHPGSTCGQITREESIGKIAESINSALFQTSKVTAVIENMSKQGHTIGGDFTELRSIIDKVDDKNRIGVCLDTCHAFAAGYDLASREGFDQMMSDFENIIGFRYLKAVHVNDSKGEVGCHLDRHENIGKGKIGIEGFRRIMNDRRFCDIPIILETPGGNYAKEIKLLEKLQNSTS